jgi:hypothetical protein
MKILKAWKAFSNLDQETKMYASEQLADIFAGPDIGVELVKFLGDEPCVSR